MYNFTWPLGLPQRPQQNYSEDGGVLVVRTPVDKGPAKQRRLSKRIHNLSCSFHMSSAQVEMLRSFVEDSLKGTIRFGFPHPRTQQIVEVRIVPQDGGKMYTLNYVVLNVWDVSLQFEVLP